MVLRNNKYFLSDFWLSIIVIALIAFVLIIVVIILILVRSCKLHEGIFVAIQGGRNEKYLPKTELNEKVNEAPVVVFGYNYQVGEYAAELIKQLEYHYDENENFIPFLSDENNILHYEFIKADPNFLPICLVIMDKNLNIWIIFRGTELTDKNNILSGEAYYDIELNQEPIAILKKRKQMQSLCTLEYCPISSSILIDDSNLKNIYPYYEYMKTNNLNRILIHEGFLDLYQRLRKTLHLTIINLLNSQTANKKFDTTNNFIVIAGHSLGGALTNLCAFDFCSYFNHINKVAYTFGSPRVGNTAFANYLNTNFPKENLFRVTNTADIVVDVPFSTIPNFYNPNEPYYFTHAGTGIFYENNGNSLKRSHYIFNYLHNLPQK